MQRTLTSPFKIKTSLQRRTVKGPARALFSVTAARKQPACNKIPVLNSYPSSSPCCKRKVLPQLLALTASCNMPCCGRTQWLNNVSGVCRFTQAVDLSLSCTYFFLVLESFEVALNVPLCDSSARSCLRSSVSSNSVSLYSAQKVGGDDVLIASSKWWVSSVQHTAQRALMYCCSLALRHHR